MTLWVPALRAAGAILFMVALGACTEGEPTGSSEGPESAPIYRIMPPSVEDLEVGERTRLRVEGRQPHGDMFMPASVRWSANGGTIEADGTFSADAPGEYMVFARVKTDEPVDSAIVKVRRRQLAAVVISPDSAVIGLSTSQVFTAIGRLRNDSAVPVSVTWRASAGTIDASGLYVAPATAGRYQITATVYGMADTAAVVVAPSSKASVQSVVLAPAAATLPPGGTQAFTASAVLSDGSTAPVTVTYTGSGGAVTQTGLYTAGTTPGNYRVIALSANGKADTAEVVIEPPPVTATEVVLSPTATTLAPGQNQAFNVTVKNTDGSTSSEGVTYAVTGGVITSAGVYTAGSTPGSFRAIATTACGHADTAAISIAASAPTLVRVVLTPETAAVESGTSRQFTATGKMSDSSTATVPVTFAATGGTISTGGLYQAGSTAGTYRVVASSGSLADTSAVTVTVPTGSTAPIGDPARGDSMWAGVNANTGYWTDATYLNAVNSHARTLRKGLIRMGMDNIGGGTQGGSFSWGSRDAAVQSHLAAGLVIHAAISPHHHVSKGGSLAEWQANWRYFVAGVLARYKGKVGYYIIDNEPDLQTVKPTPQQMVDFTRIAYEESRKVAPDGSIRIESPPTASAGTSFLRDMINAGITRYADVLGVHAYGSQINDEHGQSIRLPWEWMAASGHPMRPVANSENGVCTCWAPAGVDARTWQARWYRLNWIQHKRYGYESVLLYSIRSQWPNGEFDFASWDGGQLFARQPTYDAVRLAYTAQPFGNGGFEEPNDRELQWAIYWWADHAQPPEWSRAEFVRGDASNARSGTGYLRLDTGESTQPNRVRRVVEQLTPGRSYTVTAWVRIVGGGTATLRAMGYDHLNGKAEVAQSTSSTGGWVQRSVTFTPTKSWVVIGLEGNGTGAAGHVMYWDDVTLTP